MRAPRSFTLLVVVATLSGCVSDDGAPTVDQTKDAAATIYQDDDITVQDIVIDTAWEPTLLEAPPWRVGEWWKIEMTENFTGESYSFFRVVAGFDNITNSYLIGMPTHGFSNDVMVLHIPGFGQVDKDTLGYELHDVQMDPLQFPLEDGASWDTAFEGAAITTHVEVLNETQAKVLITGGQSGHYVYDAAVHAISEFVVNGYATYRVVGHGYDFHELEGWNGQVTVPYQHDLVFAHGCVAAVGVSNGLGPCVPIENVEVGEGYDRASFITAAGDPVPLLGLSAPTALPAASQETATDPAGEQYETTQVGLGLIIDAHKSDSPVGTWTFQHLAGSGLAFAEGIAYKVFDIQLPIGQIIETAGEHEHEDPGEGHL